MPSYPSNRAAPVPMPPIDLGELDYYSVDWSDDVPAGWSISSSAWAASAGVTISDDTVAGAITTVWITPTTIGRQSISNTVALSGPGGASRTLKRTFTVDVVNYR